MRSSGASLAHAPVELKADKDLVIEDPLARNRIPRRCIRHYDVAPPLSVLGVREAVRQNGMALQYAAEAPSLLAQWLIRIRVNADRRCAWTATSC